MVIFRSHSVTYQGEDENWLITINAHLVGLNGSYNTRIQYKEKEPIYVVDYNIYPHYQGGGIVSLSEEGFYYSECDDCGYFDKDEELLFFITWKVDTLQDEKMKWIKLKKK